MGNQASSQTSIPASQIDEFAQAISGKLLKPGTTSYDDSRALWNGMFDRRPSFIAQCESTEDVVQAVNFARDHQLLLSIKGGGHNSAGTGCCDQGMAIDLSKMNRVAVHAGSKRVFVGGGALISDVDAATQQFGLAVPAGIISHTGVGGLTLGGGFGWLSRKYGFTVDHLVSAEIVTAAGEVLRIDKTNHPDLFWAIKGGGGNFGVVTEFEFDCVDAGPEIYSGAIVKAFEDRVSYLKFHRDFVEQMSEDLTAWTVMRHAPPLPFIPEQYHGKMVMLVPFCWLGDEESGREATQPIRDAGTTLGDGSAMHPYVGWQQAFDPLVSHGARNYWKSHHLKSLSDDCIEVLADFANRLPSAETEIFTAHMAGATTAPGRPELPISMQGCPFVLNVHTRWRNRADDDTCIQWARDFHAATQPFANGVYVNFLTDQNQARAKAAYNEKTWNKLVEVKQKWDPSNLFRVNMNIKPS
ncbi:FAD-binding oxidoreductase [Pontibacter sp. G13]|uniref:FAD-binding oxidoreductase n=1 Tax=Pontibacter sp. G13 TaxID=3074898 RepID=UPI00288AFD77|nr:FAD-binding oxidoreductase [Pontibacter sp. G13]WNJ19684.1 FAD-binding oxidoreductase [Pontibacter sp. G13]